MLSFQVGWGAGAVIKAAWKVADRSGIQVLRKQKFLFAAHS